MVQRRVGRTTSAGLWRFAFDYVKAGSAVASACGEKYSDPTYFLFCRSIELALKAFLVARGVSYSKLRVSPYGHNLEELLKLSRRRRLGQFVKLSRSEIRAISLLNAEYATKQMEYIVTGSFRMPSLVGLQLFAVQLVTQLKTFCIEAEYPKK